MDLEDIRKEIDQIDEKIVELLSKRAELAKKSAAIKGEKVFDPSREEAVIQHILAINRGPISDEQLTHIFREIISICRGLEKPIRVAYWGPEGTFTHLAALRRFGSSARYISCERLEDVFEEVVQNRADVGVVPVENSTEGVVARTLDLFQEIEGLKICGEMVLPIHHLLLSLADSLERIKRVYSIPQALGQCRRWLRENLPNAEIIETATTARAAQMCREDPEGAAIGSEAAKEIYGLNVLAEGIEDLPGNSTRFLVIGKEEVPPTGKDKTTIIFAVKHKAGALYRALAAFDKYDVNLTMLESRPSKRTSWEYVFFADFQGHIQEERVKKALEKLSDETLFIKVLGSYPEADRN
ncbi:prephenate dehydratase [bacterium]|nr:prephenate dehydratase [bacterium]